jgi:ATP-dependent DNA ligase
LCETSNPFDSDEWIWERKLDGERVLFFIDKKQNYFRIQNRKIYDITKNYPEFSNLDFLKENVESIILDGELCLNDGKSADYHDTKFKRRTHIKSSIKSNFLSNIIPLTYYVFDILFVNGQDLRNMPLFERKKVLQDAIKENERVKILEWKTANGIAYYETLLNDGYEGLVAKRWDSKYENKRSSNWLKIKPILKMKVKVIGYKETSGWGSWGALITPFGDVALEREERQKEYFERKEKGEVFAEVRYQELTPQNKFRFPKLNKFVD